MSDTSALPGLPGLPGLRAAVNNLVERLADIKAGLNSVASKLKAQPPAQAQGHTAQSAGQKPQDATLPALADSTGVAHALVDDVEAILHQIEALL